MIGRRKWLHRSASQAAAAWITLCAGGAAGRAFGQAPSSKSGPERRYIVRRPALDRAIAKDRTASGSASPALHADPALEERLAKIRDEHHLPGLIGAIVHGSRLTSIAAVGVRKLGSSEPLRLNDPVHLGSCTKAMTATMLGMLVEDGLLKWSSTIHDVFPEEAPHLHPDFQAITLAQLLSHRAGLPHDAPWWRLPGRNATEQRLAALRLLMTSAPSSRPGTSHSYSNAGYVLAALMAEQVSSVPWDELMRQSVFEPLGMSSAGFGPPGRRSPGAADAPWGHREVNGRLQPTQQDNALCMGPAGTVHCSLPDWGKFASLHLLAEQNKPSLLKAATFKALHTPAAGQECAGGWYIAGRPWAGGRALNHSGSNTYWYCTVWIAPARGFATLVCTNRGGAPAETSCELATRELIDHALRSGRRNG